MATTKLTVHCYPHNGPRNSSGRPIGKREPLVHLLATTDFGEVVSITFHPDYANDIGNAIKNMGSSAKIGGRRRKVEFTFR